MKLGVKAMRYGYLAVTAMVGMMCSSMALGQGFTTSTSQGLRGIQGGLGNLSSFGNFGRSSGIAKRNLRRPTSQPSVTPGISPRGRAGSTRIGTGRLGNRIGTRRLGRGKMATSFSGLMRRKAGMRQFSGARVGRRMATDRRRGGMRSVFGGMGGFGAGPGAQGQGTDFAADLLRKSGKILQKSNLDLKNMFAPKSSFAQGLGIKPVSSFGKRGISSIKRRYSFAGSPLVQSGIIRSDDPAYQFLK